MAVTIRGHQRQPTNRSRRACSCAERRCPVACRAVIHDNTNLIVFPQLHLPRSQRSTFEKHAGPSNLLRHCAPTDYFLFARTGTGAPSSTVSGSTQRSNQRVRGLAACQPFHRNSYHTTAVGSHRGGGREKEACCRPGVAQSTREIAAASNTMLLRQVCHSLMCCEGSLKYERDHLTQTRLTNADA